MTGFDSSKLPPGIHIEQSKTPGFFTSQLHILAEADLMESMPDGDIKDRINSVPGFLKRLLLKDVNFDFKLSLPIKAQNSNADQVEDGGKTLIWNVSPLQKNKLDLTVQIPNIRNILLVAIAGLVLVLALLIWFFIRRRRTRRRRNSIADLKIHDPFRAMRFVTCQTVLWIVEYIRTVRTVNDD